MTGTCWICGGRSETAEHRIKKSDLVQQHGEDLHVADAKLFHYRGDEVHLIQGPDSNYLRYSKNLCASCNNSFTQPFDKSYETLVAWLLEHRDGVLRLRVIDFESVYGTEWEDRQRDLFKYFAKCFGCRLNEANREVPRDVVELLSLADFTTAFYVTFLVDEDFLELAIDHVGTEPLVAHTERTTHREVGYQCGHSVGWLTMMYWYHHFSQEPVGSRWVANEKQVYLGWRRSLTGHA